MQLRFNFWSLVVVIVVIATAIETFAGGDMPSPPQGGPNGSRGDGPQGSDSSKDAIKPSTDDCKLSSDANSLSCKSLRTMMSTTQITVKAASTLGSQAVQTVGQQAQQNAYANSASMATIYENSAALSAKAAEANIGMGVTQTAMGVLINSQANRHSKEYENNFKSLSYGAQSTGTNEVTVTAKGSGVDSKVADSVYNNAVETLDVSSTMTDKKATIGGGSSDSPRNLTQKGKQAAASASSYARAAGTEQKTASVDGHNSALQNLSQGGGAIVSGTFQYLQAKQLEKLYQEMAATPTATASPGADAFQASSSTRSAATITGSGTDSAASAVTAAASPAPASSNGPLGAPLGNSNENTLSGTTPNSGAPGGVAGGSNPSAGGAGPGGGVGTSAVPGSETEGKPAQYDNARGNGSYEGSGNGFAAGTGGKGNSNDPAIDPKTLMAEMLDQVGKKKEENAPPDILSYRGLASDSAAPLSSSEDIFKRFHIDYQKLQRDGRIGL
jgi:hypothetical protein